LEALETKPDRRRMGYAQKLFSAAVEYLLARGPVTIRDNVSKKNEISLSWHKKCGFSIDSGDSNNSCYGMLFRQDWGSQPLAAHFPATSRLR
jgi:ribosomal protein S18 acetylase RimI-like enzyme